MKASWMRAWVVSQATTTASLSYFHDGLNVSASIETGVSVFDRLFNLGFGVCADRDCFEMSLNSHCFERTNSAKRQTLLLHELTRLDRLPGNPVMYAFAA